MIDALADNTDVQSQVNKLYDLFADMDSIPVNDLMKQGEQISSAIASGIGAEDIDMYKLLGFDQIQADTEDMVQTIRENWLSAFDGVNVDGASIGDMMAAIDFKDLSIDQLETMNTILDEAGDRAYEYAAHMSMLASVGELAPVLDQVTEAISHQSQEMNTVSDALAQYTKDTENLVDGVDTHENIVTIYDEFAESVNKGQINTETARKQMELLIGDIVSLKEAKKWVKENEGLFLTGTDEEKVGQDLTGIFNTLHKKYNEMSTQQRNVVDSLMNVNWDTGSIRVAEADVVKLADAFGMSATSMQQALDLISTYSDYITPSVGGMVSNVQTLGGALEAITAGMDEASKQSTVAWDKMVVSQKIALQELTRGMDLDVTKLTVSQVEDIYSAFQSLQSKLGETPTANNLMTYFESIKTSAGEAAVEVQRLSDGSWSIDVTNLDAVAQSLGVTTE